MSTYDDIKPAFELYNFKCKDVFYHYNESTCTWQVYAANNFKVLHGNVIYVEWVMRKNKGKLEEMKFVDKWLADPGMRQYNAVRCLPPPLSADGNVFNRWEGFAIESHPAVDEEERELLQPTFDKVLDHLLAVAGDDLMCNQYLLNWIASIVQQPGVKTKIIPIIMSNEKGTGKGMFGQLMAALFGEEYCLNTSNPARELFGNFNTGLRDKVFVSIDEINQKILNSIIEDLKSLITEPTQNINMKYERLDENRPSFVNVCLFTNRYLKWEHSDRRPMFFNMSKRLKGDTAHFDTIGVAMKNKRVIRMLYEFFKGRNLSACNLERDRPVTELHRDMEQSGTPHEITFLVEMGFTVNRRFFDHNHNLVGITEWRATEMYQDFIGHFASHRDYKPPTNTAFGMRISTLIKYEGMKGIEKRRDKVGAVYRIDVALLKAWLEENNYMERC